MTNSLNANGQAPRQESQNRPGRTIAYGIPLGIGTGVALGLLFDNLALGIACGAILGVALGLTSRLNRGKEKP